MQLCLLLLGETPSQLPNSLPFLLLAHIHVPILLVLKEPQPLLNIGLNRIDEHNRLVPVHQL